MLELGVKMLLSYMLGSVNGSLLLGRVFGGIDIREEGSGNAGATNAFRTHGKFFGITTAAIDIAKGFVPAFCFAGMIIPVVGLDASIDRQWLAVACGAAAIIGHCYPIWYGFAGGKGAATMVGVILAIEPVVFLPMLLVWLLALLFSGWVALATIAGGLAAPIYLAMRGQAGLDQPVFVLCVAVAAFLIFTHRSNIARIRAGTETSVSRIALFRRGH